MLGATADGTTVQLAFDVTEAYTVRQTQQRAYHTTFVILIAIGAAVSWVTSYLLTRPLGTLSRASRELARGNLGYRAPVRSRDEVGQLAADFNRMAGQLEQNVNRIQESMALQERFMADFSHEMKTPMTSIIGYADLLRSQVLTPDEQMDAANYIFSEGRRLEALGGEHAVLLPLSPAAVPDCEPYLCGASTQPPLPKLRAAAEVLAASGCTVIAVPDSAGIFCEQLTAAAGVPVLSTAGAALPQLVGKLRQRASVLCTPGVRAANVYGLAARRYGLHCSYPDAPVQALLGCVQPEKACSEQVLRSIIELELARGNDCVVLDSAQLCAAFAHFGLAARYPQAIDGVELLAQAALLQSAAAAGVRRA